MDAELPNNEPTSSSASASNIVQEVVVANWVSDWRNIVICQLHVLSLFVAWEDLYIGGIDYNYYVIICDPF